MSEPRDDGGPAFPQPNFPARENNEITCADDYGAGGMTLRDWFATFSPDFLGDKDTRDKEGRMIAEAIARYHWADAMLEARKR